MYDVPLARTTELADGLRRAREPLILVFSIPLAL